jgi:DNA-binding HxlR family transcriptional regulator
MIKKRKKKIFDGIDKEILRVLYFRRYMVSRQIAKSVGISSSGIFSRLNNLRDHGIIRVSKVSGIRSFQRNYGDKIRRIKSPREIYWELDLK